MPIPVGLAKLLIRTGIAAHVPSIRRLMGDGVSYLKYYNRRILGSPNEELRATQQFLDAGRGDVIDLSLAAPPADSELLRQSTALDSLDFGYPPVTGLADLRSAIAEKLRRHNALDVDPDHQVLVCNGVSQAIGLMLDTFVDPGDRVVIFDPSFFIYRLTSQNRGARIVALAGALDDGRTTFVEKELAKRLRGARVLFLNSPANPTGGVLDRPALERIAWWCKKRDVLIFSDEVYENFQYEHEPVSVGSLADGRDRTITANGFSKSHGMAAHRVGYLCGPRYLIQPLVVSQLATAPFVSVASQRLALAALAQSDDRRICLNAKFRARRDEVSAALARMGLPHERPAGAFFAWVPVDRIAQCGAALAHRLLVEQGVMVMPGNSSGPSGASHIRISFAGDSEPLAEGLRRIANFVAAVTPIVPLTKRPFVSHSNFSQAAAARRSA